MTSAHVPQPAFELADGTPVSAGFGDVYFSREGGIAETEHVFLRGNGLPERFCDGFRIAELGFGTGLNFLVTWRAFQEAAPAGARLHYMAIEKFPLTPEMLHAALALQPELKDWAEQLLAHYPLRLPGWHRIHLPQVTLTLGFGDVAALLPELNTAIDAWFLDGFAPAKNGDMWSEDVFAHIGRLSAAGATFATFTAASAVRRGLADVGFAVEKVAGYGRKREMLVGCFASDGGAACAAVEEGVRSAQREPRSGRVRCEAAKAPPSEIIILGAGIAGATLAQALAERGVRVTVLERGAVAQGGSGNAAGVLFPQLTKRWTTSAAWYFTAYDFTLRQLARWRAEGLVFGGEMLGMLRVPRHDAEALALQQLNDVLGLDAGMVRWVDAATASAQAGVKLATGAAYFPHGTWVCPPELCAALLQHQNITLYTQTSAQTLTRVDGGWRVETQDGQVFEAADVAITAAAESAAFLGEYGVTLNRVAGQVSVFSAADVAAPLRSIVCHKGYVIPHGERVLIGATYNHDDAVGVVTDANHASNAADVENFLPGWLRGAPVAGRASVRATTPDRLPYVGQVAEGLWVSAGHGSRGMLSAPLAAEMIASALCGEMVPVTHDLCAAVNPLRFAKKL